eukprot:6320196-Prymnesium_polylepis.1
MQLVTTHRTQFRCSHTNATQANGQTHARQHCCVLSNTRPGPVAYALWITRVPGRGASQESATAGTVFPKGIRQAHIRRSAR